MNWFLISSGNAQIRVAGKNSLFLRGASMLGKDCGFDGQREDTLTNHDKGDTMVMLCFVESY